MTTWFTADLHLGHARIIGLSKRPFDDVEAMDRALVEAWNDRVAPADTVFVLGDLAMGRFNDSLELVWGLHGRIVLVPGNHDRVHPAYNTKPERRPEWFRAYQATGVEVTDLRLDYQLPDGREVGVEVTDLRLDYQLPDGREVVLSHMPYERDQWGRADLDVWRPVDEGRWLLHGHVHEAWRVRGRQLNVGVDVSGFAPVSESEVMRVICEAENPRPSWVR